jgi:hypothetical protein
MSKIGTLTTGAGVVTTINIQYVPEYLLIGSGFNAADVDVSAISWNVAGKELVNLSGKDPVNAYAKYKNEGDLTNQLVAQIFQLGFGYLANQQFQIRITNNGAGTPDIFAFSRRRGAGRVLTASQQVILDGANQRFDNFLALHFDPTNVTRADVNFVDPKTKQTFSETLEPDEIDALFGLDNISEDGKLSSLAIMDNVNLLTKRGVYISSVNLFASGANVTTTIEGVAQL